MAGRYAFGQAGVTARERAYRYTAPQSQHSAASPFRGTATEHPHSHCPLTGPVASVVSARAATVRWPVLASSSY